MKITSKSYRGSLLKSVALLDSILLFGISRENFVSSVGEEASEAAGAKDHTPAPLDAKLEILPKPDKGISAITLWFTVRVELACKASLRVRVTSSICTSPLVVVYLSSKL